MESTLDQTLVSRASQAISDIFLPFFNPDVLLKGFSLERAQSLTGTISPILWEVTQSLPVLECVILDSAMQVFTGPTTAEWGLHMFAISTDRNQQQAQAMAYRYNVQAREYVDVAEYILRFDDLKQKVEEKIESLASDKNYTFKVFRAFRGLIFQVKTEDDLISYLTNQTWSFCFACIEEDDFTRPSLQTWFISEGAQHIDACMGILNHAVTHLDIFMAFRIIAIIYCGFKTRMQRYSDPLLSGDTQVTVGNRRRTAEHFLSVSNIFVRTAIWKNWTFIVHMQRITVKLIEWCKIGGVESSSAAPSPAFRFGRRGRWEGVRRLLFCYIVVLAVGL